MGASELERFVLYVEGRPCFRSSQNSLLQMEKFKERDGKRCRKEEY